MENKDLQILADISDLASSLRRQLEELEEMIGRLKVMSAEESDYQYDEGAPIDIEIDDVPDFAPASVMVESVVEEPEAELVDEQVEELVDEQVEELVEEQVEEPESVPVEEPETEFVENPVEESVEESETESEIDEPFSETVFETATEPVVESVPDASPARQAVIDVLEDRRAWKTDMPGAPVRDIRSAISLNDRVLFINRLFNEDPMAFQDMLSRINNMTTLEEVVEAVVTAYPEWDLGSELVYRFMMAVRRKVK